jgi:hypothetical protein
VCSVEHNTPKGSWKKTYLLQSRPLYIDATLPNCSLFYYALLLEMFGPLSAPSSSSSSLMVCDNNSGERFLLPDGNIEFSKLRAFGDRLDVRGLK